MYAIVKMFDFLNVSNRASQSKYACKQTQIIIVFQVESNSSRLHSMIFTRNTFSIREHSTQQYICTNARN